MKNKEILKMVKSLEVLELGPDQVLLVKLAKDVPEQLVKNISSGFTSLLKCKVIFYDERIESIKVVKPIKD